MKSKPILYYIYDPMCSWCWGYAPIWKKLKSALAEQCEIRFIVGGLAPDSDELMTAEMQDFLQKTWRTIETKLGTTFNFDFWHKCHPRRSTYPACRAMLMAREQKKEPQMLAAIQQAYYLQAKNPSDISVLVQAAEVAGLDCDNFEQNITNEALNERLLDEIHFAHSLPIKGFPSLVIEHQEKQLAINIDYLNWQTSYAEIMTLIEEK